MSTPIQKLMDDVEWAPVEIVPSDGLPFATHSGVLVLGAVRLKCYRLNTGEAVIDPDGLEELFPGWREIFAKMGQPIPAPITFTQK